MSPHTGRGHKVFRECKWCSAVFDWTAMKKHVGTCPKNPWATTCSFCKAPVNLKRFQQHLANQCPNRPDIPADHKVCTRCRGILPLSAFALDQFPGHSGRHPRCKKCFQEAERPRRETAEYKLKHRHQNLSRNHNLTKEFHDAQLAAQDGGCAICKRKPGLTNKKDLNLSIDHCHTHNILRGFLCPKCNFGLGNFLDDPELLEAAAAYLRYYRQPHIIATRPKRKD